MSQLIFKLSKIFANFSEDLQIFINTHSPAFYSLAKEFTTKTNLYLVKSDLLKLDIELPSMNEQRTFVDFVEQADKLKFNFFYTITKW